MKPHWTFIFNELMKLSSCPIEAFRKLFYSSSSWSWRTAKPYKKLGYL